MFVFTKNSIIVCFDKAHKLCTARLFTHCLHFRFQQAYQQHFESHFVNLSSF